MTSCQKGELENYTQKFGAGSISEKLNINIRKLLRKTMFTRVTFNMENNIPTASYQNLSIFKDFYYTST